MVIGYCWIVLCVLWPLHRSMVDISSQLPFVIASFFWITALSISEDLFEEATPDATLRLLGTVRLRALGVMLIIAAMLISYWYEERQLSVWVSMAASLLLLLLLPGGKRTVQKSWLIDAMIVLRFPF